MFGLLGALLGVAWERALQRRGKVQCRLVGVGTRPGRPEAGRRSRRDARDVYHVRGVATRGGNVTVRVVFVLAVVMAFYGCARGEGCSEDE